MGILKGNELPLVSILITSYNRGSYIEEAIVSALNQTYENTELVIVDNCSTDYTKELLKKYEQNGKVRIYYNETNIGQFPNRNKAAFLAKGKYLKYLDSDDQLYSNCLEIMVSAMEKFPDAGIGISYEISKNHPAFPFEIHPADALRLHFENGLLFPGPGAIIYKASVLKELNGFEDVGLPSDNLLTLKIASANKIVAFQRDLFFWRRHDEQEFNYMGDSEAVQAQVYRMNKKILEAADCPLKLTEKRYFLLCHKTRLTRMAVKYFCQAKFKKGRYLIHETGITVKDLFISVFPVRFFRQ